MGIKKPFEILEEIMKESLIESIQITQPQKKIFWKDIQAYFKKKEFLYMGKKTEVHNMKDTVLKLFTSLSNKRKNIQIVY